MSNKLISHNADLSRLVNDGYSVSLIDGYLIIENVPYVNSKKEIVGGILISEISISGDKILPPANHVIHFQGDCPCDNQGKPISSIKHQTTNRKIMEGLISNYSFSNKPKEGFNNHYDKITHYLRILTHYAQAIDEEAKANSPHFDFNHESSLKYTDTNSSRSFISAVSNKIKNQKIAIIGIGGTGSYILDFVAKTEVKEIHLYDSDVFSQHNAFRSPGAPAKEVFNKDIPKVSYFNNIYSNMHNGIVLHEEDITNTNMQNLSEMDCVFVSIDISKPKGSLFPFLIDNNIPFIDVGMGVEIQDEHLFGILRVTSITQNCQNAYIGKVSLQDEEDDVYASNIQISELNALNAALAVIKWKKMFGFYDDQNDEHHTLYTINTGQLLNEDCSL